MTDQILKEIIKKIKRGPTPDSKLPDSSGNYLSLCPFHDDVNDGNFVFSTSGYKCSACGKSGSIQDLAQNLDISISQKSTVGSKKIISLEEYSSVKKLPIDFLYSLGISERKHKGQVVLRIPYFDQNSREVAVRDRLSITGQDRFRWPKGSKIIPYGLWKMDEDEVCYQYKKISLDVRSKAALILREGLVRIKLFSLETDHSDDPSNRADRQVNNILQTILEVKNEFA